MAIRNYTSRTLKILFASSGNICAFPGCESHLVEDGVVLCDIAHIIAISGKGPRATEASEQGLNSPDNLMLLCLKHHRIVDDLPDEYPSEKLKRFKADHEEAVRRQSLNYDISTPDLEKAVKMLNSLSIDGDVVGSQLITTQGDNNTTSMTIYQIGDMLGVDQVKSADAAAQYNKEVAARTTRLNVQLQQVSVDKDTLIEALKDPSVAEFVRKSYLAASLEDDPERYKIIAEAIRSRIRGDGDVGERKDVAFAQVPDILSRLTTNQMKLIAAHYAATHLTVRSSPSLTIVDMSLGRIINPLGEISFHDNDVSQIAGSGAGTVISIFQDKAFDRAKNQYQHLFIRPIPRESVEGSTLSPALKANYLRETPDGYLLTQPTTDIAEKEKNDPAFAGAQNLLALVESQKMTDGEIKQKLEDEAPSFARLIKINDETALTSLTLTLPGMALAVAVLESCLGQSLANLWATYDDQKTFPLPPAKP